MIRDKLGPASISEQTDTAQRNRGSGTSLWKCILRVEFKMFCIKINLAFDRIFRKLWQFHLYLLGSSAI